jgi:hypothetical protein
MCLLLVLASLGAACGEDEEPAGPGECDPEASEDSCEDGRVCTVQPEGGGLCQLPPGAKCDPEAPEGDCRVGSECRDRPEGAEEGTPTHLCLVIEAGECDPLEPFCADALSCAELEDGTFACHAPLLLRGHVTDAATMAGIADAHVIGINEEYVAVTDVAVSAAPDGAYTLEVPAVRDMEGKPLPANFMLRASAQDYQSFPGGLRTSLPISTSDAVEGEAGWVVEVALTEITLIALADDGVMRHMVVGKLRTADDSEALEVLAELAGVMIVADGSEIRTATTDKNGQFTVFNVPDGSFELQGYAARVAVEAQALSVAGADVLDVVLRATLGSLSTVSGNVQIVNAAGGSLTTVILVVESTFDADFARGETPRGLRAPRTGPPSVSGDFTIADVPDGDYAVLAAFENDDLVRDPDTNIAGTSIVHITVAGGDLSLSESFKVTQALEVFGPGAEQPEAVTSAPTLRWADDSSEDWYEVRVFDAFGEEVWTDLAVPGVSGSDEVSVAYGGPMDVGMYYQFRVTSWRMPGNGAAAPISATEDLRGVFYVAE